MQRLTYIDSAVEKRAISSADISRRRPSQHVGNTPPEADQVLYIYIAAVYRSRKMNAPEIRPEERSLTDRFTRPMAAMVPCCSSMHGDIIYGEYIHALHQRMTEMSLEYEVDIDEYQQWSPIRCHVSPIGRHWQMLTLVPQYKFRVRVDSPFVISLFLSLSLALSLALSLSFCLSVSFSFSLSFCLSVSLSPLSLPLSFCLSVSLSVCLSVSLSFCLSLFLSLSLSLSLYVLFFNQWHVHMAHNSYLLCSIRCSLINQFSYSVVRSNKRRIHWSLNSENKNLRRQVSRTPIT